MSEQLNMQVAFLTPPSTANKRLHRRGVRTAIGLLLTGLIVTALAVRYTKSQVDAVAKRDFDYVCNEIQSTILDRLHAQEQLLRGTAAFFEHSDSITRKEWCRFAKNWKIEQQFPGIQGIGFALLIPRQQLAEHVEEFRAKGFSEYHVWPERQQETYSSVIYVEPFTGKNLHSIGYDMLTDPVRRKAMEQSRDGNVATLTGKVVLVQETDTEIQAGTLMYVPVYREEIPSETVDQRRVAILGWVFSPYGMNDLIQDVLGGSKLEGSKSVHLEVFDGEKLSPEALLYDSQSAEGNERPPASALALQTSVDLANHRWTLCFTQGSNLAATVDYGKVWVVLLAGTSVSLLLFGLSLALLNTQFKAWQIATKLTAEYKRVGEELQESKQFLQEAQRIAHLAGWKVNPHTDYLEWTDGVFDIVEAPKGRQPGLTEGLKYFLPEYIPTLRDSIVHCLATGERFVLKCQVLTGTDKTIWTEVRGIAPMVNGERAYVLGTFQNITEQKEQELRQCLSAEILDILNNPHALSDAINRILAAIQRTMGFDAVGIRLQNGDDFPYHFQSGFSSDFLQTENTLIVLGQDGGPCRDKNGNISLKCTCGLVISGKTDPAHPLFTPGGSFWTNDSLPLLKLPAEHDPRLHPSNRCIHEGFCSRALIPVRAHQEIVGLLQINDRKKDCFTLEMIHFFEEISANIGVALMRKQAEETLRQSKEPCLSGCLPNHHVPGWTHFSEYNSA